MKKIAIYLFLILLLGSCTKELTSINNDPKSPTSVPSTSLFTNAQHTLVNTISNSNVNSNIFRLVDQYWQETTYTDESNYDIVTRPIPQTLFTTLYRDVLRDFETAKSLYATDISNATTQKNDIAVTDIMEVYSWYYLVTTFGNIPYKEALDINNTFPKYDDQKTIYYDLLTRLDADIANLNATGSSLGSADIVYGGDVTKWKKFANSFKLKMGMTIADFDAAKAKTTVESAVQSGVFTSSADNASFQYLSGPPNTNQVWVDLVQSGRKDFVAASTVVNTMQGLNDPRLSQYFTTDAAGGYSGAAPGASASYSTFSKPSATLTAPDYPALLLSYDEVEFFLAEAIERGFNVGGTASTHYNNAVTSSILYWGGTSMQAATYLAQPSIAYATAAGTYKQKIGLQKWIALYNRGWEEWIEVRRFDYPILIAPATAKSAFPVRLTYPINEQNTNTTNYNTAASAIGGDKVTTKLFWDIF
ncbi:MAG TPA: SusD/RagB family nutrient-binding outer membrane lipoprotein [Chitinophagaceae bacterium]